MDLSGGTSLGKHPARFGGSEVLQKKKVKCLRFMPISIIVPRAGFDLMISGDISTSRNFPFFPCEATVLFEFPDLATIFLSYYDFHKTLGIQLLHHLVYFSDFPFFSYRENL